uniref:Aspartic peptidase DDI1-type domain-containing protein n=1 Tax=Nicotiana tabacum TaxID=4097 RepID=A0A1S3ZHR9_TOBAC|nr:PREDICTED: uncharacterized protein LOC107786978 [Nicotiana tabacum]
MAGNGGRPVIEAARPNLSNMTQAIVKPDITGHFELKQYMVQLVQSTRQYLATNQNTRPAGALPIDTEKNPQVSAITLRTRRELEKVSKKRKDKPIPESELIPKATQEAKKDDTVSVPIQLNIPLVDVIRDIPKYAKYIKDIVSNKRRLIEFEIVAPTEDFTIPVRIGNVDVGHALCDLGARINLMSLSLYKKLGLGAPKPTTMMLQLADRSITYPEGVIEDVLLKIGKFIFPADFIILDFETDEKVPIILGRPLLDTGDAIIKVREGKMIMRVDNEEAVFNVYKAIQLPRHYEGLSMISAMEMDEQFIAPSVYLKYSLEKAIVLFESLEINNEVEEIKHILNASCEYIKGLNPFEPLNRPNGSHPKPSIEEAPKLELKHLPSHLHYAYLGSSDTLSAIISSDLSELQEEKLLRVLREHKRAIGWIMSDMRGISPAFCMHKILMEEGHKPSIEQ